MDAQTASHFADIVTLAENTFEEVEYNIDFTPERAILRLQARWGRFRVHVTELFSDGLRKYRYYLLDGERVTAGFDNSPDPRAVRLKYGRISSQYAGKPVPHLHLEDKTRLVLTDETLFQDFLNWIINNVKGNPYNYD